MAQTMRKEAERRVREGVASEARIRSRQETRDASNVVEPVEEAIGVPEDMQQTVPRIVEIV